MIVCIAFSSLVVDGRVASRRDLRHNICSTSPQRLEIVIRPVIIQTLIYKSITPAGIEERNLVVSQPGLPMRLCLVYSLIYGTMPSASTWSPRASIYGMLAV